MIAAGLIGLAAEEVAEWIASLGIEAAGPLRFERIGFGQSNLTFLITDAEGRRWVLRRPPLGHLLASAHDVAREARILSALQATDLPTPRVYGVRDVEDAPLVLIEFVDGQVVDRLPVAEGLSLERRREIGLSLAGTLALIHAVDLDETGLRGLSSHKPYAQRQLKRWSLQWERSKTGELPLLDELTTRLTAAVPVQRELTLVHGDFHLGNVIISRRTGSVTAVLDWELCTLGDPLADVGTLLAYWPANGEASLGGPSPCILPGFPTRDELVQEYLDRSGRDPAALGFWHALGLWKTAIIGAGVLRRALEEPQNRAQAGCPSQEEIASLVVRAHDVAAAAGI
ncbi:phosphotransferase family protein [Actinomadura soli]|uniref:phosphotransferase family protein n=1 Tax=Actinomadura soli TaxID=2508997 RepID=UPI00197AAD6E|nr:phosphotransferase family protein [Actinomadura soli]